MLVLTRYAQQSCLIDEDIEVVVLAIEGNRVRLGFKAPEEVPVLRSELTRRAERRDHQARSSPDK